MKISTKQNKNILLFFLLFTGFSLSAQDNSELSGKKQAFDNANISIRLNSRDLAPVRMTNMHVRIETRRQAIQMYQKRMQLYQKRLQNINQKKLQQKRKTELRKKMIRQRAIKQRAIQQRRKMQGR